jgi:uncharacterized protein involved in exopolysaccharide biosynthesis
MGAISQAQVMAKTAVLTSGLLNNLDRIGVRGIDGHAINELRVLREEVQGLEAEQEALKSRLKEKTQELNQALGELKRKAAVARKIVKLQVPQPGWKEFGITDVK